MRRGLGSDRGAVLLLAARDRRYGGGVAPIPFTRLFGTSGRRAVESIVPRRTFDDVILPPATRRALDTALAQVTQHDLIFTRWGLGERHPTGLALAFNFAGPPGTGKTICAEAIAHSPAPELRPQPPMILEEMMGRLPLDPCMTRLGERCGGALSSKWT